MSQDESTIDLATSPGYLVKVVSSALRAAMDDVLLHGLQRDGLVSRAEQPSAGRILPTELTDARRRQLAAASAAVRGVEVRMLAGLAPDDRTRLTELLRACAVALGRA